MARPCNFSCVVLLVALVLLSAASIGRAQKTGVGFEVRGQVFCTADGNPMMNGTQSSGAAGVNVTLSCGQGGQGHSVDVAAAVTDSKGMFNITAHVSVAGGIPKALVDGGCDVKVDLPVSNSSSCNRLPKKGHLMAQVTVLSPFDPFIHAIIGVFSLIA